MKELEKATWFCDSKLIEEERKAAKANPKRKSRWAECTQAYVMPLEKRMFPDKHAELEKMHHDTIYNLKQFEAGRMSYQQVIEILQQQEEKLNMPSCFIGAIGQDGREHCI